MKKILILSILVVNCCFAQQAQRKLVWEENFKGPKLDKKFWNFEYGDGCPDNCGWGNNERETYTQNNHSFVKGNLVIEARMENGRYTSTRITTKGKKEFKYGRIEARAKLPAGQGIWPAFWMLGANVSKVGWPKSGEIDIMEYVGKTPHQIYTTLHTPDSHGNSVNTRKTEIANVEDDYHVYAIDWTKDQIEFFVDEQSVYTFKPDSKTPDVWPFDKPFYIIVNLAVGGNFGGPEVDDTIFPQQFAVDYIKVYQ